MQCLKAGTTDVALALGAEKMNIADKLKALALFESGWDVSCAEENYRNLIKMGEGVVPPPGSESDKPYSKFMAIYAALCRHHMKTWGTTQRQIAAVSAKNHCHSVHNPYSQFRKAYTIEEILAAPPITYPLTLPMCAAVVRRRRRGRAVYRGRARAHRCRPSPLHQGGRQRDPQFHAAPSRPAGTERRPPRRQPGLRAGRPRSARTCTWPRCTMPRRWARSSRPRTWASCRLGAGGPAAERGEFSLGGRIPINTSGGLESKGHPLGATGIGQLYELVTQLRGEAGARQVPGARHAIQENGGGMQGVEEAAVAIHILSK